MEPDSLNSKLDELVLPRIPIRYYGKLHVFKPLSVRLTSFFFFLNIYSWCDVTALVLELFDAKQDDQLADALIHFMVVHLREWFIRFDGGNEKNNLAFIDKACETTYINMFEVVRYTNSKQEKLLTTKLLNHLKHQWRFMKTLIWIL